MTDTRKADPGGTVTESSLEIQTRVSGIGFWKRKQSVPGQDDGQHEKQCSRNAEFAATREAGIDRRRRLRNPRVVFMNPITPGSSQKLWARAIRTIRTVAPNGKAYGALIRRRPIRIRGMIPGWGGSQWVEAEMVIRAGERAFLRLFAGLSLIGCSLSGVRGTVSPSAW